MEIVLYILGAIALLAVIWLVAVAVRTLHAVEIFMRDTQVTMQEMKKDIDQMTGEVTVLRIHLIPILDNVADITQRVSGLAEGLAPRIEAIYDTVDDTLNVVRGAIDDVERIKDSVVETIEAPLNAVRNTSTSVVGTIVKGVGVVRDLIGEFRKK